MKRTIPAVAMFTFAAVAPLGAATAANPAPIAPVGFGASHRFETSLAVSYGSVSDGYFGLARKQSGVVLDAQVFLPRVFFLSASHREFTDVSSSSLGLGVAIGAGNGRVTLGLNLGVVNIDGISGEWQTKLSAAYEYRFANGLFIGASAAEFINSNTIGTSDYALALNAGWKFGNGLSLNIMLADNDMILGLPDSGSSLSAGVKYTF